MLAALGAVVACAIFLTFVFLQAQRTVPVAVRQPPRSIVAPHVAATPVATTAAGTTATAAITTTVPITSTALATVSPTTVIGAATAAVTVTVTVSGTAAAAEIGPGGTAGGSGSVTPLVDVPAPFFSYGRPFSSDHAIEASRYYPYGTKARGEYLLHHGVDIGNAMDTPVLAIGDGEVVYAGDDRQRLWGPYADFYGNVVVLRHADKLEGQPVLSLYGHLNHVDVAAGQTVRAGEQVGRVGMAGIALGPHLHLEVRLGEADYESTRNSELFLAPIPGRGTIVGRALSAPGTLSPNVRVSLFGLEPDGGAKYYGETRSYPTQHVHPSAELGENFLFADIPAGRYRLVADSPVGATANITLTDGSALLVELAR